MFKPRRLNMKYVYLKMMIPMTLATLLANAQPSNFTQTNPIDSQIMTQENFFSTYDNASSG